MKSRGRAIKLVTELSQRKINTLFSKGKVFPAEDCNNSIPLSILIVPPQINLDKLDASLDRDLLTNFQAILEQKLNRFLDRYYSIAALFLGSDWGDRGFQGQDSIARLFEGLKGNSFLILESEIDGNYINLRLAYWGLKDEGYIYNSILDNYHCQCG